MSVLLKVMKTFTKESVLVRFFYFNVRVRRSEFQDQNVGSSSIYANNLLFSSSQKSLLPEI